jgi:hypothetical protein
MMSTLVQIESAVAALPAQDQWSLLTWLQARLKAAPKVNQPAIAQRPIWLDEIRQMRDAYSTGKPGTSVEQLITEIRS